MTNIFVCRTVKRLTEQENQILAQILSVVSDLKPEILRIHTRLEKVESRLEKVESRLEEVETRLNDLETRLANLETRVANLETRVEHLEAGQKMLKAQLDQLAQQQQEDTIKILERLDGRYYELKTRVDDHDQKFQAMKQAL